jgi:thymidylate synthase (FAD)
MSDRQIQVTFLNSMGCDKTVVNAARVSFNKQEQYLDTSDVMICMLAKDIKLIKYLAKHKHMSPFGHCFASFHVKAPVFVARQLVKHKFLRWNEVSRRYVSDKPELYQPSEWRGKAEDKKQGSAGVVDNIDIGDISLSSVVLYNSLIDRGVCPEQARMVLPQSLMTEWWWSGSLDAFADMCKLRLASDTQAETRLVAEGIDSSMRMLYPYSWKALTNREDS